MRGPPSSLGLGQPLLAVLVAWWVRRGEEAPWWGPGGGGPPPHSHSSRTAPLLDQTVKCADMINTSWQEPVMERRKRVTHLGM